MDQLVVLVDSNDKELGTEEKMKAHMNGGKLHRALSVFVFNDKGETMLQRRAMSKYHTQGKWSNTCCSHQKPGESTIDAAHRRLKEEMGFDCEMHEEFNFPYEAEVGNGLTEQEYDHIVFGRYDKAPNPNKSEVMDWRWISISNLKKEIAKTPENFTPWLKLMINEIDNHYKR